MATLYSIAEAVKGMLDRDPASASRPSINVIKSVAIQVINSMLGLQHFTKTMGGGENIPDGLALAAYDNIAVESYKNISRSVLPVMPVSLPLNMGIFHVGKTDDIVNGFIPFQPGEMQLIGEEELISDLMGQIGYWPAGKYIYYNRDITINGEYSTNEVFMFLVVKDLSLYAEFDMLPIPGNLENDVIVATYKQLSGQTLESKKVDVISKEAEA